MINPVKDILKLLENCPVCDRGMDNINPELPTIRRCPGGCGYFTVSGFGEDGSIQLVYTLDNIGMGRGYPLR